MNRNTKREVVAALIKAGRKDLAQQFAARKPVQASPEMLQPHVEEAARELKKTGSMKVSIKPIGNKLAMNVTCSKFNVTTKFGFELRGVDTVFISWERSDGRSGSKPLALSTLGKNLPEFVKGVMFRM